MPELPVKLELSRLSRFDVLNLLAPLVPGGVVLGAVALQNLPIYPQKARPSSWGRSRKRWHN